MSHAGRKKSGRDFYHGGAYAKEGYAVAKRCKGWLTPNLLSDLIFAPALTGTSADSESIAGTPSFRIKEAKDLLH
jgi:hypothetical protein